MGAVGKGIGEIWFGYDIWLGNDIWFGRDIG